MVHVALSKQIMGFDLISHYRLYDYVFAAGIQFTLMHPRLVTILSHTHTHSAHWSVFVRGQVKQRGARECATLIDTGTDP